jgi:tRNA(fMet)-specific endonuclease VapC
MFALDTDTLIYFFKGVGRVPERLLAVARAEVGLMSFSPP